MQGLGGVVSWRLCTHIPGTGSEGESPPGLWTCDPRCSVWEEADPGDCGHVAVYMVLRVTPDIADIEIQVQSRRVWLQDRERVWGVGHPGDCGQVTLGARSGRG